jgi:hypothetical protein
MISMGNDALLADRQRAAGVSGINPDDASMVVIRALWVRLRH